jgi:hypothetical protein
MLHQLPLWARWALAAAVGIAVLATIVIVTNRAGPEGIATEEGTEDEINRIADIAIAEDQAPHSATLSAGAVPVSALERAIARDVRQRIADHNMVGPLQGVSCSATGPASVGRVPYRCALRSADVAYSFLAVVDEGGHRLTWCKVDPPATAEAGMEIPVSGLCRA